VLTSPAASYLADLRNNRVNRPGGARPQPGHSRTDSGRSSLARTSLGTPPLSDTSSLHHRSQSDVPNPTKRPSISASVSSRYSTISGRGRDYIPPASSAPPLKPGEVVPSDTYIERGQRWMEKEEAFSLRQAMEDMDVKDEPKDDQDERLYQAALCEASELVYQHQNGIKPPEPDTPYQYKSHLRKNSYAHARTASTGRYGDNVRPTGLARDPSSRSVSGSSTSSDGYGSRRSRLSYGAGPGDDSARPSEDMSRDNSGEFVRSKAYTGLAGGPRPMASHSGRRRSSMKRNISGEVATSFSGQQIYEDPAAETGMAADKSGLVPQPLALKPKNPLNRVVQFAPDVPPSPETPPSKVSKIVSRFDIHRNPPSQSRNPQYTTNSKAGQAVEPQDMPRKNGVEIRGDDIRQATSMRLKDRSPKLPTPSYVSNAPGRPIVSFDANWKAPDEATDKKPDPREGGSLGSSRVRELQPQHRPEPQAQVPSVPSITLTEDHQQAPTASPRRRPAPSRQVDGPSIPTIAVSEPQGSIPRIDVTDFTPSVPTIVLPDDETEGPGIPVIVTPDDGPNIPVVVTPADNASASPSRRPLPVPGTSGGASRSRARPRAHYSPAPPPVGARATARCHECRHPIEGRFVALAGVSARFHPGCFTCYTCGTPLEALEISPEPDAARGARLERLRRRAAGDVLPEDPGETMAEDGDDRLRFYCHLDWHELFAPRCRHCTTPILGEGVVALGHHYHVGHFFCAECGDPFGPGATHIEKDGYAWCVACQTRRTERRAPRCRACGEAALGQYVQALGAEWHDRCFRCAVCEGGFDDGQIFPREGKGGLLQVVCRPCRERELKA